MCPRPSCTSTSRARRRPTSCAASPQRNGLEVARGRRSPRPTASPGATSWTSWTPTTSPQRHPHRRGLPRHHLRVPAPRCAADGAIYVELTASRRPRAARRPRATPSTGRASPRASTTPARDHGIEARILSSAVRNFGVERRIEIAERRRGAPAPLRRGLLAGRRRGRLPARAVRRGLRDRRRRRPRLHRPRRRVGRRRGVRARRSSCPSPASATACARSRTRRSSPSSRAARIVLEVLPHEQRRARRLPQLRGAPVPRPARGRHPADARLRRPAVLRRQRRRASTRWPAEHFGLSDDELRRRSPAPPSRRASPSPTLTATLLTRASDSTPRAVDCRHWPTPGAPATRESRRSSAHAVHSGDPDRPHPGRRQLRRGRLRQHDDSAPSTGGGQPPRTSTAARAKKIKVGLVTDIGGLNDRSFNALANKGLEDAESELGHHRRAC